MCLRQFFQQYLLNEDNLHNENGIIELIKSSIQKEKDNLPSSISSLPGDKLKKLISLSDDIKILLRHLALPNAIEGYLKLKEQFYPPQAVADRSNDTNLSYSDDKGQEIHIKEEVTMESYDDGSRDRNHLRDYIQSDIRMFTIMPDHISSVTATNKADSLASGISILRNYFESISSGKAGNTLSETMPRH
jgi:hypothetical protein